MIRNYFKTAFRNIYKNKLFSLINVLGLGIGTAAVLLIFQYVSFEFSFDRFHENESQIYRLNIGRLDGGTASSAMTAGVMAPILKDNFAGIKSFVRLRHFPSLVAHEDSRVHEDKFYFTDSTFFETFSYKLLEGDKSQVLREPNTIVLTETAAMRIFGRTNDLIGEFLTVDNAMVYKVDGIAVDARPSAHFEFEYLASIASIANHYNEPLRTYQTNEWYAHYFYTYLELDKGVDPQAIGDLIKAASKELSNPEYYELYGTNMGLYLQPISDIHLNPLYGEIREQGNQDNLYILTSAGIIILLLAIVNYTNLSTAQSIRRIKEVALRKTLGARKRQLVVQFLGESVLLCTIAFILAVSLIQLLQSSIVEMTGLSPAMFSEFYQSYAIQLVLFVLIVGLMGGLYPAMYLSSFGPAHLFKDNVSGKRKFLFRKAVIFFQFAISMILISSTVIVFSQVQFMKDQELGIDTEQILLLPTYGNQGIHDRYDQFRQSLQRMTEVKSSSLAELSPGDNAFGIIGKFEGMDANRSFTTTGVDYGYLQTYDLKLLAGRDFSRTIATDLEERVIINKKLCDEFGWTPEEAIGKVYDFGGDGITPGFVIGVVDDFHFNSLKRPIFPLVMAIAPNFYQKIAVKIESPNLGDAIRKIESAWNEIYPQWPFDYSLVDQEFELQYASEGRFGSLFMVFTVLGLFIGALGIYGLVQLMTEYRRKELSIRKVLGAQIWKLMNLLSKEYLLLMLLSFLVCAPVVYFFMRNWLADFAYNITIEWWMLGISLLVIVVICSATIGFRLYKSASANPVDSLRYE